MHSHTHHSTTDRSQLLAQLRQAASTILERARALGADQAEVNCNHTAGLNVSVRMGQTETIESACDRGVAVTVYFKQRKGSASTADLHDASLDTTVKQACAIARYTEPDSASGLADADLMARQCPDFKTWHPKIRTPDALLDQALACEAAGRNADTRIENSGGGFAGSTHSLSVYANSHGFIGEEAQTYYSLGCTLIAGQGEQMQRDGWYTSGLAADDLLAPAQVGRIAAQRTLARLAPRRVQTANVPVIFSPEVSRSLLNHFFGAISGGALYRRSSFLLDALDTQIFPRWFTVEELPHLNHGLRSSAFDAEGVATREVPIVVDGILRRYLLGSYSARRLGLKTTANAGGIHNIKVNATVDDTQAMIRDLPNGLLVTELMGQGVNAMTGDYSRGAAGFWIDKGQIAYPVDGVTIAGQLREMYAAIEAVGRDFDRRSHIHVGAILIGRMTVAGD